jgi:hypothetical protein
MPDVFNRTTDSHGGSFASDAAKLTFPALSGGGSEAGLLVQSLNLNYTQNVSLLYEVGSPTIYYVGGRTRGGMGVNRVAGPRVLSAAFYRTYGDVCNARTNILHLSMEAGCPGVNERVRSAYTARYVVITTVSAGITANDMLINEAFQALFSSLVFA